MRNHDAKFGRFECGEGPTCAIAWGPIIGSVIGGGLGLLGQKEQADAIEEGGGGQYFGPGMEYAPGLLRDAQSLYQSGQMAPGDNPLANLGRQNQLGYAQGLMPQLIGQAQQGWGQALSGGINPYTTQMIQSAQNDMLQDFNRYTLPSIADASQATGGYGGSRQGVAQGIAAEGLTEAMGDVSANMLNNAWGQAQQQQARAWGTAPWMTGAGLIPGQTQAQIGTTEAGFPLEGLQNYAGMIAPWASPGAQAQSAGSPIGSALTGAGAGLQLGNQLGGMFNGSSSTGNVPGDANWPAQPYYGIGGPGFGLFGG